MLCELSMFLLTCKIVSAHKKQLLADYINECQLTMNKNKYIK